MTALTYTAAALQEHSKLIENSIDELKENLSNRQAIPDYSTYCTKVGMIIGLRMAIDLCDEAVKKLNEN